MSIDRQIYMYVYIWMTRYRYRYLYTLTPSGVSQSYTARPALGLWFNNWLKSHVTSLPGRKVTLLEDILEQRGQSHSRQVKFQQRRIQNNRIYSPEWYIHVRMRMHIACERCLNRSKLAWKRWLIRAGLLSTGPPSSEYGTHKTVKAIF